MKPTFRSDLTCSREEQQQGVVVYRIDDPKSQTSFRLYEIEYLIAKKLDGARTLSEVIEAVKQEFNLDVTEADLQRFVNQLESMGFLEGGRDAEPTGMEAEPDTAVMQAGGSEEGTLDLLDPIDQEPTEVDAAEYDRLLRSAFMHVKQGYIVHARDYFFAARELKPNDDKLEKLAHHLDIIGDSSGPAEVEYLWNQAAGLFPDVAEEVGPLASSSTPGQTGRSTGPLNEPVEEDIRSRVMWTLILIAILVVGVGGLWWVVDAYRIFESAAPVRVATLRAERIPVFYEKPAVQVMPGQEEWLEAEESGKLRQVLAKEGDKVEPGQILAQLELPRRVARQLEKAEKDVVRAQRAYEKAASQLADVLAKREAVQTERAQAEEELKELLKPNSVLEKGGAAPKAELEKWKTIKVRANRKLTRLAKRERGPRRKAAAAEKRLNAAREKLEAIRARLGGKLVRAPFAGVIRELKAKAGAKVKEGDKLVLLRDPSAVKLVFELAEQPAMQVGGEAHVAVGRGKPSRAKVVKLDPKGEEGARIVVRLQDPSGGFLGMSADGFKLVREHAYPAFRVPPAALVVDDSGTRVFVALQKQALEREVEVLHKDAAGAVIRDTHGALRDGEQVVVSRVEGGDISTISDGSFLEVELE